MKFRAKLLQGEKTATGIEVPREVVEALGPSRKPAVTVTINGFSYRTTVASMGGKFMVPVSAERRKEAGVSGGGTSMLEAFLQEVRLVDQDKAAFARLGLRLSEAELEELRTRLGEVLNDFADRAPTADGTPYSVFIALHPDATRD